jgi:primosomal protein N' (replication factor Y)
MNHKSCLILEIAFPLPFTRTYSYSCPEEMSEHAAVGMEALVPVKNRNVEGFVIDVREQNEESKSFVLKPVVKFISEKPLFNKDHFEFYQWISNYYHTPVGEVINAAIPKALRTRAKEKYGKILTLNKPFSCENLRSVKAKKILSVMNEKGGKISLREMKSLIKNPAQALRKLIELRLLNVEAERIFRDPFRDEFHPVKEIPVLTADQIRIVDLLQERLGKGYSPFLLHGVTGSGKTEIYMRLISASLARGKSVIVLVPEIALTPQLASQFVGRFGTQVTVLHSGLSEGDRLDSWTRIMHGDVRIVVGARSAIFAPVSEIGLIVVDEEHESSYKQEEKMRYNARDMAFVRAQSAGCLLILGSATPSLETFHLTKKKKCEYLYLPERINKKPMPQVTIIDMRYENKSDPDGFFSERMVREIQNTVNQKEQVMIFLNRRGFSSFFLCRDCGFVLECKNCSITMTHHSKPDRMVCHYCGFTCSMPERCPSCTSGNHVLVGFGTERIQEILKNMMPGAVVERLDSDTAQGKNLKKILRSFSDGKIDVLVGTQLLAKGHDFPNVTLVGVILAELGLRFPDFRASERTFQLLMQVSGRAGRGDRPGRVFIQTFKPDHYSLQAAASNDFFSFISTEEKIRAERKYPPFTFLALIELTGENPLKVSEQSRTAVKCMQKILCINKNLVSNIQITGPSPAHIHKLKGRTRHQILLKSSDRQSLHQMIGFFEKSFKPAGGVTCMTDIDPVNLL